MSLIGPWQSTSEHNLSDELPGRVRGFLFLALVLYGTVSLAKRKEPFSAQSEAREDFNHIRGALPE